MFVSLDRQVSCSIGGVCVINVLTRLHPYGFHYLDDNKDVDIVINIISPIIFTRECTLVGV